jgi:16S rRNA (uracil1498-N3)-methyltransferase
VVERDRQPVATFLASAVSSGGVALLDEGAAHHVRVRRLAVGDAVRLTDGRGICGEGTIQRIAKSEVEVRVGEAERVPRAVDIQLFVPVADRDRMLWLAEKVTELGVAVWQPVVFARSRSVSPRGEGAAFREKVLARMRGALRPMGHVCSWMPPDTRS